MEDFFDFLFLFFYDSVIEIVYICQKLSNYNIRKCECLEKYIEGKYITVQ